MINLWTQLKFSQKEYFLPIGFSPMKKQVINGCENWLFKSQVFQHEPKSYAEFHMVGTASFIHFSLSIFFLFFFYCKMTQFPEDLSIQNSKRHYSLETTASNTLINPNSTRSHREEKIGEEKSIISVAIQCDKCLQDKLHMRPSVNCFPLLQNFKHKT